MNAPRDKTGIELKVGDWVLYPWWNDDSRKYDYFCNKIRRIPSEEKFCDIVFVHSDTGSSTPSLVEKMPKNKKERDLMLFLKKLER